jgi:hypothetical protein
MIPKIENVFQYRDNPNGREKEKKAIIIGNIYVDWDWKTDAKSSFFFLLLVAGFEANIIFVCRNWRIPVITGTAIATKNIDDISFEGLCPRGIVKKVDSHALVNLRGSSTIPFI